MLQVSDRPAPPSAAELAAALTVHARIRAIHGEGPTLAEVRAALAAPPLGAELAALTELRAELARIRAVHGEEAKIDEERVRAALAAPPLRVV